MLPRRWIRQRGGAALDRGFAPDLRARRGRTHDLCRHQPASDFTRRSSGSDTTAAPEVGGCARWAPFAESRSPIPIGPKRRRDASWTPSTTFRIPRDWLGGVYLGKLTELQGGIQSYVVLHRAR